MDKFYLSFTDHYEEALTERIELNQSQSKFSQVIKAKSVTKTRVVVKYFKHPRAKLYYQQYCPNNNNNCYSIKWDNYWGNKWLNNIINSFTIIVYIVVCFDPIIMIFSVQEATRKLINTSKIALYTNSVWVVRVHNVVIYYCRTAPILIKAGWL